MSRKKADQRASDKPTEAPVWATDGLPVSRVEHEFSEADPFERIIVEQRGVRELVTHIFNDDRLTLFSLINQANAPVVKADELRRWAERHLKNAGEKTQLDVLAPMETRTVLSRAPQSENLLDNDGTTALARWLGEIRTRKGCLSQEAIAAEFLFALDSVDLLTSRQKTLRWAIFNLCEAWHWLRVEADGTHTSAVAGTRAERGRSAGPQAKKHAKQQKLNIVREEVERYRANETSRALRSDAPSAVAAIQSAVNARFEQEKFKPWKYETLLGEVRAIMKVLGSSG